MREGEGIYKLDSGSSVGELIYSHKI